MTDRNSNASGALVMRDRAREMAVFDAMPEPMRRLFREHVDNLAVSDYAERIVEAFIPEVEARFILRELSAQNQVAMHAYRRRIGLRP